MKKRKILAILVALATLLVSACANDNNPTEESDYLPADMAVKSDDQKAKSIIHLQMREVDVLDPILTSRQSVRDALLTVFEPLFNITDSFGLENVLAQSYAFNSDATMMTLQLKSGVLWHNGHALSADDVVYTVNKIKSHPQSSYYENCECVEKIEKTSESEVVFYLKRPNSNFVYSLYFPIEFRHFDNTETIVGTGAYMFSETDGKSLSLVKNPLWHGGEIGAEGIKFIYMRTSSMAEEAFKSGKLHAITKEMIDTDNFAIKKTYKKYEYPNGMFEFMGFNTNRGIFKNSLVRSAAANAINRSSMEEIFEGVQSGFPVMSKSEDFSPNFDLNSYSTDYAKEVVFSAGWSDIDGDGIYERINAEGIEKLQFTLLVSDRGKKRIEAAHALSEQLYEAGFSVTVEICDIETFNSRVAGGEYDAYLASVYTDEPYDVSMLLSGDGAVNYQGYKSEKTDEAILKFESASDRGEKVRAFNEIQSCYSAHQPLTGLVFRTTYVITTSSIKGEVKPYPYSPYANIATWIVE